LPLARADELLDAGDGLSWLGLVGATPAGVGLPEQRVAQLERDGTGVISEIAAGCAGSAPVEVPALVGRPGMLTIWSCTSSVVRSPGGRLLILPRGEDRLGV
jgi:hypothetical protein